jgi:hypothetical protein
LAEDFGKYLFDSSKVVLSAAVITPIFKDKTFGEDLRIYMIGATIATIAAFVGWFLKNIKKIMYGIDSN